MCGRFFLRPEVTEILAWLDAMPDPDLQAELADSDRRTGPRWNIAPTQAVLAASVDPVTRQRLVGTYVWGFTPIWWKQPRPAGWINARSEDAATSGAFRSALKSRRCLVPASGFYEWKGAAKSKVPHAIEPGNDDPLFAFGGIHEQYQGRSTVAILTTANPPAMEGLHDRMPVVVPRTAWDAWLDPKADPAPLLAPWEGPLRVYAVGSAVGNVRNQDGSWFGVG